MRIRWAQGMVHRPDSGGPAAPRRAPSAPSGCPPREVAPRGRAAPRGGRCRSRAGPPASPLQVRCRCVSLLYRWDTCATRPPCGQAGGWQRSSPTPRFHLAVVPRFLALRMELDAIRGAPANPSGSVCRRSCRSCRKAGAPQSHKASAPSWDKISRLSSVPFLVGTFCAKARKWRRGPPLPASVTVRLHGRGGRNRKLAAAWQALGSRGSLALGQSHRARFWFP